MVTKKVVTESAVASSLSVHLPNFIHLLSCDFKSFSTVLGFIDPIISESNPKAKH